jgi:ferritin-like metal-binding protein YciE
MARKRKAASTSRKKTSSSSSRKRTTTSARKTSAAKRKTTVAKRSTAKRSTAKRKTTAAKRSTAKRSAAKRSTAKRSTAKRSTAKRGSAKRKSSGARRAAALRLGSLRDVLVAQLGALYDGERQLVAALPQVAAAATHPRLREAVEHHLEETRDHVRRLDTIFGRMRAQRGRETDDVMAALVADAQRFISATGDAASKDAALIAAAQKVEHHEIAGYGTARSLAEELGLEEVRELLNETLDQESNADTLLTQIATGGMFRTGVNEAAAS